MDVPSGDITMNVSTQYQVGLGSQIKNLVSQLNDGELATILNDSWAQAAVWCQGEDSGFTYEVLVRAETFDDETLELKYRYITNKK